MLQSLLLSPLLLRSRGIELRRSFSSFLFSSIFFFFFSRGDRLEGEGDADKAGPIRQPLERGRIAFFHLSRCTGELGLDEPYVSLLRDARAPGLLNAKSASMLSLNSASFGLVAVYMR